MYGHFSFQSKKENDIDILEGHQAVLWKRLKMETDQHRNGSKSESWSVSFFFQELLEIPQKLKSIERFPNIFDSFPICLHLIRFPFFWIGFRIIFSGPFPVFSKSFKILICWSVSCFFFDPFPHILCSFLVFGKSYKFSVCWLASFFTVRFLIFQVCFRFKKIVNFQFIGRFPVFFDPYPHIL